MERPRRVSGGPKLKIFASSTSPAYHGAQYGGDRYSGRCRLAADLMNKYGICIGEVVLLKFTSSNDEGSIAYSTLPMTVWTDSSNALPDSESVFIDSLSIYPNMIENFEYCEILEVSMPKDCPSVMLSYCTDNSTALTDLLKKQIKAQLIGRVVYKGMKLYVPPPFGSGDDHGVSLVVDYAPMTSSALLPYGLVGMCSIISWSTIVSSNSRDSSIMTSNGDDSKSSSSSDVSRLSSLYTWTPAVTAIADAFNICSPYSAHYTTEIEIDYNQSYPSDSNFFATTGLLLLGPPGTGKTFSVKALQDLCCKTHNIQIYELNIPNLISSASPMEDIDSIMEKALDHCRYSEEIIYSGGGNSYNNNISSSNRSNSTSSSTSDKSPGKKFSFSTMSFKTPLNAPLGSSTTKANATSKQSEFFDKRIKMSFIVIDEIDALGTIDSHNELQAAIKSRIFEVMDSICLNKVFKISSRSIRVRLCFIGTSNRVTDVDSSFRRGGRLEREVLLYDSPSDRKRLVAQLLVKYQSKNIIYETDSNTNTNTNNSSKILTPDDIESISGTVAEKTGGYVTADIVLSLFPRAAGLMSHEVMSGAAARDLTLVQLWGNSFSTACQEVPPSSLRGVSISLPQLSFHDVIGNEEAKLYLTRVMQLSNFKYRSLRKMFNIEPMGGILLHGPPGNSKTRLVTAAAASFRLPLITLSVADVYSPYVGDAEAEIRRAFQLARRSSPCVMFLDEIDALVTNRDQSSASGAGSNSVESRVLSTLLNEMDGVGQSQREGGFSQNDDDNSKGGGIIVVGATNRLNALDNAILRKGRFQNIIFVTPPNEDNQIKLVDYFSSKFKLNSDQTESVKKSLKSNISGAEIENLCREQMMNLLRDRLNQTNKK